MKKKVLAALLSGAMAVCVMGACGISEVLNENPVATQGPRRGNTLVEYEEYADQVDDDHIIEIVGPSWAAPEPLPEEYFAQITFDSANAAEEGYVAVVPVIGESEGSVTYDLAAEERDLQYVQGPVGEALYLDGSFGLDLNLEATNTNAYTISFWINAQEVDLDTVMLQVGYNMDKPADEGNNVTWLKFCTAKEFDRWGMMFPAAFSRNEASDAADGKDCLPWLSAFDYKVRDNEWIMVTLVATGVVQEGVGGTTTIMPMFYINDELVYNGEQSYVYSAYFDYTWDASLAPNVMKPGDSVFQSLFGVNGNEVQFKGYVDQLRIYDIALSDGQVTSLYELGNPDVETITP